MNVAENMLLQQMQTTANMPKTVSNGSSKDQAGSFQDMMDQAGQDTTVDSGSDTSVKDQPARDDVKADSTKEEPKDAPVQTKKEQKAAEEEIDPNAAAYVMDLFRPEIVKVVEEPEVVLEVPVEAVEETVAVETAEIEVPVMETAVPAEEIVPEEEAPAEFRQAAEQAVETAPEVQTEKPVQQAERPVEAAEQMEAETAEETTDTGELRAVRPEEEAQEEETQGEAAEMSTPVFQDVKAAPVKVAEHYEPVDTQAPEMDEKLAASIMNAAQNGADRVQIQLTPANLGAITIDLTRNADGALEVVIHAATGKAEGLLNQHLDGLNAALQSHGNNQPVHVEVQRGQESQEQHMFQHADPDGRGNQQRQQQEKQRESESSGEDFLQKLRLGLIGLDD